MGGKKRFPKKDGVVFRLYYGGGTSGTATEATEDQKENVKHVDKKEAEEKNIDDIEDSGDDENELEEHEGESIGEEEEFDDEDGGEFEDEDGDDIDDSEDVPTLVKSSQKRKNEDIDDINDGDLAFGPDDDYDYSQHIRAPGKGVFVEADVEYTEKVLNNLNMGHKVKKLRDMAGKQYVDVDDIVDEDIDDALFANNEHYDTLDDNFVVQANGGAPVDVRQTEVARLRKTMQRMKLKDPQTGLPRGGGKDFEDFDDFEFGEYDEDYDNYDDDDDVDARKYTGHTSAGTGERKPRLIDEQFDHLLEQYDESNIGEWMDPRDPEVLGRNEVDTEDPIFQEYILARRRQKGPAFTPSSFADMDEKVDTAALANKENQSPEEAVRYESDAEYEDGDPFATLYPPKKVEQWDCDTIISTYSNLENHPKLIHEPSNKIKLSKKTGMPLGVLAGRQKQPVEAVESDSEEEEASENTGKARAKNETPEERKERKRLVKEAKKASREKKKLVKQAYKSEEIKQTTIMVSQRVHQRVVYKF